ncbi:MAG: hypothetical protein WDM90_01020 [Ferruginibacter sp.]
MSSNAKKLIEEKLFFFPYERYTASDKLISDLHISKLYDFIPLYTKVLPDSTAVLSKGYVDFTLPVYSEKEKKDFGDLLKIKSALGKLNISKIDEWKSAVNDFKISIAEINQSTNPSANIDLRAQLLQYDEIRGKEYQVVLILK